MGLLDDAIREHLDLKRRRGADPAEVERAEREALGPVRRGPEEPESAPPPAEIGGAFDHQDEPEWHEPEGPLEPDDDHVPTGSVEAEDRAPEVAGGPATELHDPFAGEPEPFDHEPFEAEPLPPPAEPEPLTLEQQPRRRGFLGRRKQRDAPEHEDYADHLDPDDDPFAEPPQAATPPAPHPAAGAPPPERHGDVSGETVEYEVEAAFEAERHGEDEDVLEETPEFLQDTPDHDRLWFEQRPPRDFDFDG